jgi:enterochelin esterase-like enzyme
MLIERVDEKQVRVTFVWPHEAEQVSVRAQVFDDRNAMSHPMTRVGSEWRLSSVVPSDAVFAYQFIVDDPFLTADMSDLAGLAALMAEARTRSFADPAHTNRIYPQGALIGGVLDAPPTDWDSVAVMPDAEPMDFFDGSPPDLETVEIDGRSVTWWGPRDATTLVVLLDGECWLHVANLPAALEKLTGEGELMPARYAFVHNKGGPADRMREQTCNDDFADWLADAVAGKDFADVIIGGDSLAGLAATHAAVRRPDVFTAVISTSGSHWWGLAVDGEPEWLTRQIAAGPETRLRFWVDVGTLETGAVDAFAPGVDQRAASRHLRTVLTAKGADVTYHEAPGGHDFATFRRSTIKALRHFLSTPRGAA